MATTRSKSKIPVACRPSNPTQRNSMAPVTPSKRKSGHDHTKQTPPPKLRIELHREVWDNGFSDTPSAGSFNESCLILQDGDTELRNNPSDSESASSSLLVEDSGDEVDQIPTHHNTSLASSFISSKAIPMPGTPLSTKIDCYTPKLRTNVQHEVWDEFSNDGPMSDDDVFQIDPDDSDYFDYEGPDLWKGPEDDEAIMAECAAQAETENEEAYNTWSAASDNGYSSGDDQIPDNRRLREMASAAMEYEADTEYDSDEENAGVSPPPLRRSLNPDEARFSFTELDLAPLPDSVTIRRHREPRRRSIDDHVPLTSDPLDMLPPPATPKRGRPALRSQLITPPDSSCTSQARIIKPTSTSPIRQMRMGLGSSPSPSLSMPNMAWRVLRDGTLIMDRFYPEFASTSPPQILRSGRTPFDEAAYLIRNSGFDSSFNDRLQKAYPKRKMAITKREHGIMPLLGPRGARYKTKSDFEFHEDRTATMGKKPRYWYDNGTEGRRTTTNRR